jgi:2,4-dienoyl-CoA reductase-like NADH-dependent reductase (Old Yellow Enzyme family)
MPVAAPSTIPTTREANPDAPEALTKAQIDEVIEAFAAAAARARRAGFDAVEIHAAHGFLLSQFLSPLTNFRDDEYGGDHERRSRIHLEVLAAVRGRVGSGFPVFVRLGMHDERPGGLTLPPACWTASQLAAAGAAMIDVSGGQSGSEDPGRGPGYFVAYAEAVKDVVEVPVMVAGGITEPQMADVIIRSGRADIVGIGRAMLDDPDWTRKAAEALGQS